MVSLIWAKSSKPLSVIIRKLSNADCSHFAICFDRRVVFHSDLQGVHICWLETFQASHEVVHQIEMPPLSLISEEEIYQKAIAITGRLYNFPGLLYFGYRLLLKRLFNLPIPNTNALGSASADMCMEVSSVLDPVIPIDPKLSMTTPHELYVYVKEYLDGQTPHSS